MGKIVEVVKGQTTAHVRLDIGGGVFVTASTTSRPVDNLKPAPGKEAYALIKSSDVMTGIG